MSDPDDYPHTPQSLRGSPLDFGYYLHGLARQDVFYSLIERMQAMYRYWSGGEKSLSPLLMTKPSMENHEHWYGVNDLGLVAAFTWPEYVDDKPVPYSLKELGKRTASDVHRVFYGRLDRFIAMAEARGLNYDDICRGTDTLMQTSSGLPLGVDLDTVNHLSDFAGIIYDSPSVIGKRRYPHLDRLQSDIAIDWTKTAAAVTLGEIHWGASQMLLHMADPAAFQRALPSPPPPDSKYYPLFERLDTDDSQTVTLTLDEVGRLLALPDRRVTIRGKRIGRPEQDGGLPESAYTRRNWWANRAVGKSRQTLQSRAWLAAGYTTANVRLDEKSPSVEFRPMEHRDLWQIVRKALRSLTPEQLAGRDPVDASTIEALP